MKTQEPIRKIMNKMKILCLCFMFCIMGSYSQNLIVNGDAEVFPFTENGWVQVSGNWEQRHENPLPQSGDSYFFAGANPIAILYQEVDVSDNQTQIDQGNQPYIFVGYLRSYPQNPADEAEATVEYMNSSGIVLDFYTTGPQSNTNQWILFEDERIAPIGTRTIKITLTSTRNNNGGVNNDGYFDNLQLTEGEVVCPFDPFVEGDILFCPDQTEGELICTIQNADSYQWFSRPFSGGSETPIPGATNYLLPVTNNDILNYFSVDVTIDGCTERSPEVLLDQLIFLPPVVETTGDYIFDGSNFLICEGESMYMTLMNPYDTNITWYRDGSPIPGENEQTLEVSTPGSYTVSGAPAICPDYIQFLGLDLVVIYNTDPNECDIMNIDENERLKDISVYPNPVNNILNITAEETINSVSIVNILGQELYRSNVDATDTTIDLSGYAMGTYFVKVQLGDWVITEKIIRE